MGSDQNFRKSSAAYIREITVNHNMMGETTGLQFIIATVKIICHLSTNCIMELQLLIAFVIALEEKPNSGLSGYSLASDHIL